MHLQSSSSLSQSMVSRKQVAHIIVAGLGSSGKNKLIWQISETPLEYVDIASEQIPTRLPDLSMGQLTVDSRLTTYIWGAPDEWRHDYVNYLVNIQSILAKRGDNHRVMGMIVMIDSIPRGSSVEEEKLLRLIASDWKLPHVILASHPYHHHARPLNQLREIYKIDEKIPLFQCDVTDKNEVSRSLINFLYHAM